MRQTVGGSFVLFLRGIPFLMTAAMELVSKKGSKVHLHGVVIGPIVLGFMSSSERSEGETEA